MHETFSSSDLLMDAFSKQKIKLQTKFLKFGGVWDFTP